MSRWITVANRLPFSIDPNTVEIKRASGGLVSALSGVKKKSQRIWVGCATTDIDRREWLKALRQFETDTSQDWRYHPVFVSKSEYDKYYNGFSNDVLWPLLHYQSDLVNFSRDCWETYRAVNQRIAEEVLAIAEDDDLIWVHDFHLFLVPEFIKRQKPHARVGFFLHVPFPTSELFRQLPMREEILESILASDLVGFHDYSYLQHFCSAVLRILGRESEFFTIRGGQRTTRLGVFPVSIDTEYFMAKARDETVRAIAREIKQPLFTFLGIDRLDYMKGLELKLEAMRSFLRRYPHAREKVRLVQVAVPTRQGVPNYAKLAQDTARIIGEINGEFSTPTWSPIHYIHSSVSSDELVALYQSSDALLVTSKRDGMNLVALEYIACQDEENPGVVLLSEFTGASSTLSHVLRINPWDFDGTAEKMQIAMEMPRQEKHFRMRSMQKFLRRYTATDWATRFITKLEEAEAVPQRVPEVIAADTDSISRVRDAILAQKPERLLLFIDYDGTLVPIEDSPELAGLPESLRSEIHSLVLRYPWLKLVVVSGRDSHFLQSQFNGLPVMLAAEHGAKYFDPELNRWRRRIHRSRSSWYASALEIVSDYARHVPRSFVEKKHFSIAWHYRQSPSDYAETQARKLAQELELGLANLPVSIIRGKKVIEIRAIEANKGDFARAVYETQLPGTFTLAIGDDNTDEDMFRSLKGRGLSIHVGNDESDADLTLTSQSQVMPFLRGLLEELTNFLTSVGMNSEASQSSVVSAAWSHHHESGPVREADAMS